MAVPAAGAAAKAREVSAALMAVTNEWTEPVVLVALIASIALLSFRVWSQSSGSALTRTLSWVLDVAIVVLVVLFFLFFIIRFKTLG
jgi:hypothetical protein